MGMPMQQRTAAIMCFSMWIADRLCGVQHSFQEMRSSSYQAWLPGSAPQSTTAHVSTAGRWVNGWAIGVVIPSFAGIGDEERTNHDRASPLKRGGDSSEHRNTGRFQPLERPEDGHYGGGSQSRDGCLAVEGSKGTPPY
ncbi:hypothetical protein B0H67DRAFT_384119 [Lasiosphaeris hirsuta]|uniref:Secreted protein n=1 Tax=Lasiosphaeris hirsuta TaxID=260670 RepID=A0AA39ZXK7_9PEZI|nr:hypothetical protein B0H67DRAFT_384119 [Lasiosphaeris hirsuta]